MTRWLLAAEADKIQDFVFRSTHLREVVGGSQLLTRFCQEGARALLAQKKRLPDDVVLDDILVADGGSFSVLFDSEEEARDFGQSLAQLYRTISGSTLTVAEPIEMDNGFPVANRASREALRLAKDRGRCAAASEHLPYAAFCASCGLALAYVHERLHAAESPNYLCLSCRRKADAREDERTEFLFSFKTEVVGEQASHFHWPGEADDLAEGWDPRNYVAYLVADGNGMGKVFEKCATPGSLRSLSESLTQVLRASLAEPTRLLMRRAPEQKHWQVPALPLILGGDDLFVLLPAPYALDFAQRFCLEYERRMSEKLVELGIEARPTMAAGIVICKSKYPYTLVHQHGHSLLTEAKRLSKAVAKERGASHSVVNFDVILGSRLAERKDSAAEFQASLRPYWVVQEGLVPPLRMGLPLQKLIEQRYELRILPMRRLAQLRALFAPGQLPSKEDKKLGLWQARLEQMKSRIARSKVQISALDRAISELGGSMFGLWYDASRLGPRERPFSGHGLPDLLEMWDFCLDLDLDRSEYDG